MMGILLFLGELNDRDIDWLAKAGCKLKLPPGAEVFLTGKRHGQWHIILEGECGVSVAEPPPASGNEKSAAPRESGSLSVSHEPQARTFRALTPVVVLSVPVPVLNSKLKEDPQFAGRLYRAQARLIAHYSRAKAGRRSGAAHLASDSPDQLDMKVMDSVHLAGARFNHLLARLQAT